MKKRPLTTEQVMLLVREALDDPARAGEVRVQVDGRTFKLQRCGLAGCQTMFWASNGNSKGHYARYCSPNHQQENERRQNVARQRRIKGFDRPVPRGAPRPIALNVLLRLKYPELK